MCTAQVKLGLHRVGPALYSAVLESVFSVRHNLSEDTLQLLRCTG